MKNYLKLIFILLSLSLAVSCSSKKSEDPILLPPNFAEVPDLNNPEKPTASEKDASVERIKELLLKSD